MIFDWGGVLAEDPAPGMVRYIARMLDSSAVTLASAFNQYLLPFQLGQITEHQFWSRVCQHIDRPAPQATGSLWARAFSAIYRPRHGLTSIAWRLRDLGIRICVLSNTEPPCVGFFNGLGHRFVDHAVFSCNVHRTKPDPALYLYVSSLLQTCPSKTIYLDDNQTFVRAGLGTGLRAHVCRSITDVQAILASYGILV